MAKVVQRYRKNWGAFTLYLATVRSKVVVLAVERYLSLFTYTAHGCSSTVRRECWWDELVVSIEL